MNRRTVKKLTFFLLLLYSLFLIVVCFSPQPVQLPGTTPGLIRWGRLLFIIRPFNSILALTEFQSLARLSWSIVQNLLNIFLLFPWMFCLLVLFPSSRKMKTALLCGFLASLSIEVLQLVFDLVFDINRVFDVDDLLTNTLGSGLSLICYRRLKTRLPLLQDS